MKKAEEHINQMDSNDIDKDNNEKLTSRNELESKRKSLAGKVYGICEKNYLEVLKSIIESSNFSEQDKNVKVMLQNLERLLEENLMKINHIIRNTHCVPILIFDLFITYHECLYFKILIYEQELRSEIHDIVEILKLLEETNLILTGKNKIGELEDDSMEFLDEFLSFYPNDKMANDEMKKSDQDENIFSFNNINNYFSNENNDYDHNLNDIESKNSMSNISNTLLFLKENSFSDSSTNSDLMIFDSKITKEFCDNKITKLTNDNNINHEIVRIT